jgi:hypothetical protein
MEIEQRKREANLKLIENLQKNKFSLINMFEANKQKVEKIEESRKKKREDQESDKSKNRGKGKKNFFRGIFRIWNSEGNSKEKIQQV